MKTRTVALASVTLVASVLLAVILVGCSEDQSPVDRYFEETGPLGEPATRAAANWTGIADSFAEANLTTMTNEEYADMLDRSLDAATQAYVAYRDALAGFRVVVPPQECEEVHLATTEALSLAARGYLEIKTYIESVLSGQSETSLREGGNQLLADAGGQKQRALILIESSGCQ